VPPPAPTTSPRPLGLRLAAAPAVSVTLWALAAALLGVCGLGASIAGTSAVVLVLLVAVGVVRRWTSGQWPRPTRPVIGPLQVSVLAGLTVTMVMMDRVWVRAYGTPEAISAHGDVTWHSYLVALLSTGTPANPFTLVPLDPLAPAATQAYPWGMHIVAALVREATGSSVAVALHATAFAFLAVAYPLGLVCLGLQAARTERQRVVVAVAVPILAAGYFMFPWRMEHPLVFPAGLALLPGVAAAVLQVVRSPATRQQLGRYLLVAAAVAGVTITHPSVLFALVLLVAASLVFGVDRFRPPWTQARPVVRAVVVALLAVPVIAFLVGRCFLLASGVLAAQPPIHGTFAAWLWIVTSGWLGRLPQYLFFWLLVAAAICAVLRRVMLGPMLFSAFFFALAAASRSSSLNLVHLVAGVWYDDVQRIAAIATVISPLLVGTQLAWALDTALSRVDLHVAVAHRSRLVAATAAFALLLAAAAARPQLAGNSHWVSRFYHPASITANDRLAFAWLSKHAVGQRVMNPGDYGVSGWMYALQGVHPVIVQATVSQRLPARRFLELCLNQIDTDPRVRPLLTSLDVTYVFTTVAITRANPADPTDRAGRTVPGMTGLDRLPAFKLVFGRGDAQIYQIVRPAAASTLPTALCTGRPPAA